MGVLGPLLATAPLFALTGTSASRILRMLAADRLKADRIATNGKNVHTVVREYGRDGHDIPVAQSTNYSWNHIHPMMTPLQTWLTLLPTMVLMQLPLDFGKTRNLMTLTFLLTTICSTLKQVFATLWTIQEAVLTILAAAISTIKVPSVIPPRPLRLPQRPLRRLFLLL